MTVEPKFDFEEAVKSPAEGEAVHGVDAENPDAPPDELATLREQLAVKPQEAKDNYDRYVRQIAETENFKKRNARERDDAIRFANEVLLRDLLPVIDNLERAIVHANSGETGKPLVEGLEMVLKAFLDALNKFVVTQIAAVGQRSAPSKQKAIAQVDTAEFKPKVLVKNSPKAYLFPAGLLRAALSGVARTPKPKEKKMTFGWL